MSIRRLQKLVHVGCGAIKVAHGKTFSLRNKHTGEIVKLTQIQYNRFFDNRCPFEWEAFEV